MADALRELVATFGVQFDDRGVRRGDRALDGLKQRAEGTGAALRRTGAAGKAAGSSVSGAWTDAAGRLRAANGQFLTMAQRAEYARRAMAGLNPAMRAALRARQVENAHTIAALRQLEAAGKRAGDAVAGGGARAAGAWTRVRDTLAGLGIYFGLHQLVRGVSGIVVAASDADETMNVLQESFKGLTQEVLDFSATAAAEVGRSEYQLREFAGTIGAIVSPMLRELGAESTRTAAQVSTDFAKLAVDLSSFFNTSEADALIALRAGLVGESEPLRRFGVNIVEQNLANFAGVKPGDLQKMSQSEKTLLRYRFIMDQTQAAQGDAARTADQFANSSRALMADIKDTAVTLGRRLLPAVGALIRVFRSMARGVNHAIKTSRILEGVLLAAAAAATVFGVRALWAGRATFMAWVRAAIPIIAAVAVLIAAALAIDDVMVAMEGGDSVFGTWLDGLTGIDRSARILRTTLEALGMAIYALFHGGGTALDTFVDRWKRGMRQLLSSGLQEWLELLRPIAAMLGLDTSGIDDAKARAKAFLSEGSTGARGLGGAGGPAVDPRSLAGQTGANGAVLADAEIPRYLQREVPMLLDAYPGLTGGPEIGAPRAPAPAVSNATTDARTEFNITVNGASSPRETGREVERAARKLMREERRKVATGVGG